MLLLLSNKGDVTKAYCYYCVINKEMCRVF